MFLRAWWGPSLTTVDHKDALVFLETVKAKVNKPGSQDAYVYALVESARIQLLLKELDSARAVLDEAEKILERFDSVENVVHASFYRVNADYYVVCLAFEAEGLELETDPRSSSTNSPTTTVMPSSTSPASRTPTFPLPSSRREPTTFPSPPSFQKTFTTLENSSSTPSSTASRIPPTNGSVTSCLPSTPATCRPS